MEWQLEGLLPGGGKMRLLWGELTHVLTCRYCCNSCLQSPGNLLTLLLFIIWQIQRWRQLRKWPQLKLWCFEDMMQKSKELPFSYHGAFFDCLWKQKSEEEEDDASLGPMKPFPPKEIPIGEPTIKVPLQLCGSPAQVLCGFKGFSIASGASEQILKQPLSHSRSFPTFQTSINLHVRHMAAPGSSLKQSQSQFFWGLPSLHNEFLQATFLSSNGHSHVKLSTGPIFFNMLAFLPKHNCLLPQYWPPNQFPAYQVQTLEESASDHQLPQSSLHFLSLALHLKLLLAGHKRVLPRTEAHAQSLTQQKDAPSLPKDQTPHPLLALQNNSPSKLLPLSEIQWAQQYPILQLIPDLHPISLLLPTSLLGVLTRRKIPWQNEDLKASKVAKSLPGSTSASLPELQEVNPVTLADSEVPWETMQQKQSLQIAKLPTLTPCLAPKMEYQITGTLGVPPRYEDEWETTKHKLSLRVFEHPVVGRSQSPDHSSLYASLPELHTDSDFVWRNMQQGQVHQGSNHPAVEPLRPVLWPPTLAETLKVKPIQPDLRKEEILPTAKAETPSSQEKAVPDMPTHLGVQVRRWSKELELKLKNLLFCSLTTNSAAPHSRELTTCLLQQILPLNTCPYSSNCCVQQAQPTQVSHCHQLHSFSQTQSRSSDRVKQWFQREGGIKKMLTLVPSKESCVHLKEGGDKCPDLGKSSNPTVPALSRRHNKASALALAKESEYGKKTRLGDFKGTAGLRSPRFTGKSQSAQAQRQAKVLTNRFSQGSRHRDLHSLYAALPQQLLPEMKGHQS